MQLRMKPAERKAAITKAAVKVARRIGADNLTRVAVADAADCSEALVSLYLGDRQKMRRTIKRAMRK